MHHRASGGALPACQVIMAPLATSRRPVSPGRTQFVHHRLRRRCSCRSRRRILQLPSLWTLVYLRRRPACMTASSLQSPWQACHRQITAISQACHQSQYPVYPVPQRRNTTAPVLALHFPRRLSTCRTLIIRPSPQTKTCHLMISYMPWSTCTSSTSTLGAQYYTEKPPWTHYLGRP